ncbi:response regulator transcription factor [Cumulibacter manganitolerans]|uniref:response regulator transcription factor n=1 Tax=Cumulibacter manganitolerans TaxID=1884992 RepID=UPI001E6439E6|nr:response regulator transcription factor [Cumulibacter manganitolerans]
MMQTASTEAVRVCVVDDDTLIRDGARVLFSRANVVDTFASVEALLQARPAADVVLLDLNLRGTGEPLIHGAMGVNRVSRAGYRVLIYTNERRLAVLARCLAAGARGIVHKSEPIEAVERAIDEVARGGTVVTLALAGLAEAVRDHGGMRRLTPRQREILAARARGESFRSIGQRLFISERTAQDHMNHVNEAFADYLATHSPADLERDLGIGPGDLNNL